MVSEPTYTPVILVSASAPVTVQSCSTYDEAVRMAARTARELARSPELRQNPASVLIIDDVDDRTAAEWHGATIAAVVTRIEALLEPALSDAADTQSPDRRTAERGDGMDSDPDAGAER